MHWGEPKGNILVCPTACFQARIDTQVFVFTHFVGKRIQQLTQRYLCEWSL